MSAFSSETTDLFEKPIFRIEKLINALKTYSETFKIEFTGWLRTMYQKAGKRGPRRTDFVSECGCKNQLVMAAESDVDFSR